MRLEKILAIISSHSSKSSSLPATGRSDGPKQIVRDSVTGLEIDLNLVLEPEAETGGSEDLVVVERGLNAFSSVGGSDCGNSSLASVDISTVEKSSEGECDPKDVEKFDKDEEEEAREVSVITEGKPSHDSKKGENRIEEAESGEESDSKPLVVRREEKDQENGRRRKREGYLDLLIEAVRQISGGFDDEPPIKEEPRTRSETEPAPNCCRSSKRKICWTVDFYGRFKETAPLVRSNRGRSQVLPSRYRDSVLEPWK